MGKSIYNIEKEYLEIAEVLQENGGELTGELETALVINKEELQVKAANYGYVIKGLLDDNESIDAEIERLTALKKASEKTIDRLKFAVSSAMNMYGIKEIKLNNIKINFRASKSVEIENESLIPAAYKSCKEVWSVSKKSIGDDLKAGIKVPGAVLFEDKKLQIK